MTNNLIDIERKYKKAKQRFQENTMIDVTLFRSDIDKVVLDDVMQGGESTDVSELINRFIQNYTSTFVVAVRSRLTEKNFDYIGLDKDVIDIGTYFATQCLRDALFNKKLPRIKR